jgi:hypothetical protein
MYKITPELFPVSTKEIQLLTQKSAATARRKLKELRAFLGRSKGQPVFLKEYCDYYGYPLPYACQFFGLAA